MRTYKLLKEQDLPITIEEAWDFFSSPENLKEITPPHMGFEITSGKPARMYPGQIISYKVRPLPGYSVRWVTEITHVSEPHYFVDEQRAGPYKMWHHEHRFEEIQGGVRMTDEVTYALPFGILGWIARSIFVKNELEKIFNHRNMVLLSRFGPFRQ
jgi:ligand-binding SRPBCC domain-containing protein